MTRRGLSTSSCFLEETFFSSEKELGFWKPKTMHYCQASCHEEEESFGSMEEMEAQTIGNLLPAEDDLFSGVINGLEYIAYAKGGDNAEDFDLFSSVGGMELEIDDASYVKQKDPDFIRSSPNGRGSSNGSLASAHSYGELPSRTLLVRNISSKVEDSELRVLFKQYGDIRNLYTACKHRGFAMISYFDLRAATNAMRALQNKLLGCRKLDIHYSIPKDKPSEEDTNQGTIVVFNLDSSVTNDVLRQIIGINGEIKEIHEIPLTSHHKSIEFYDIRAAEAACRALNKCNIAGKLNKVEPSCLEAASLMQKHFNVEQVEADLSRSPNDISSLESMSTVSHWGKTFGCIDNSSVQRLHFASHVPLSASTENVLSQGSSCLLKSVSSSLRVTSAGNHFGLQMPSHYLDQVKFSCKCIPSFRPHSFRDCQDNLNISIPHNSSSTVAHGNSKSGFRVPDRMNGKHTSMVGSNGQPMQLKGGVSGPSGNVVTCPIRLLHCSNFQHHSSSMAWLNSPLFCNGVDPSCAPQLPAFSGMPNDMPNKVSPPHHLYVESAPSISPSPWNREHGYTGKSPEGLAFCLDSLASVGFPGGSALHPLGRASCVFSQGGGTCMEKSTNNALHFPHQMSHICPGQNTFASLPTSFGFPHECGRNLSHQRNQGSSGYADKKQFELDIDCILAREDMRTTLMIKNIPNKYTSKMLLSTIDEHCRGTYDFIYLPIDFKNKCNVGYAFINLIDPLNIIPFYKAFNGKKWEKFNSEKVVALAYARIQGKAALVTHFQNSSLMNEDKRCRPILFCTNGPNAGEQEPFPMGTTIRIKAGKA